MVGKTNEIKRSPGSYSVGIPPKHIKKVDFPTDCFGPEVELYSSSREINGRADIVEAVSDSVIRVTDYKTGNALDQNGEPNFDTLLQFGEHAASVLGGGSDEQWTKIEGMGSLRSKLIGFGLFLLILGLICQAIGAWNNQTNKSVDQLPVSYKNYADKKVSISNQRYRLIYPPPL